MNSALPDNIKSVWVGKLQSTPVGIVNVIPVSSTLLNGSCNLSPALSNINKFSNLDKVCPDTVIVSFGTPDTGLKP